MRPDLALALGNDIGLLPGEEVAPLVYKALLCANATFAGFNEQQSHNHVHVTCPRNNQAAFQMDCGTDDALSGEVGLPALIEDGVCGFAFGNHFRSLSGIGGSSIVLPAKA